MNNRKGDNDMGDRSSDRKKVKKVTKMRLKTRNMKIKTRKTRRTIIKT